MITILILPSPAMAPGMEFRSEKQKTIILLHTNGDLIIYGKDSC